MATTAITSASTVIPAEPDHVFAFLTDVDRLPSWNAEITRVLRRPERLDPHTEYAVELHAAGMTWASRTRVLALDRSRRHFAHRSGTDDDNPSFTTWTWDVTPDPAGARVTVTWDPNPRTLWRRCVVVHWRRRCLARQVPRSLQALTAALAAEGAA
jgi:hypothetical protein